MGNTSSNANPITGPEKPQVGAMKNGGGFAALSSSPSPESIGEKPQAHQNALVDRETSLGAGTDSDKDKPDGVALRFLTFYRDGFQFEDRGPDGEGKPAYVGLIRWDDPKSTGILEEINTGGAPSHLLGIRDGQVIEMRVVKKFSEECPHPHRTSPTGSITVLGSR